MSISSMAKSLSKWLVSFVVVMFTGVYFIFYGPLVCTERADVMGAKIDIMAISTALKMHKLRLGEYPDSNAGILALVTTKMADDSDDTFLPKYPLDPWGNPFIYHYPPITKTAQSWDLYSMGDNGIDDHQSGDDVYLRSYIDSDE